LPPATSLSGGMLVTLAVIIAIVAGALATVLTLVVTRSRRRP
jgi:hypothetical protein